MRRYLSLFGLSATGIVGVHEGYNIQQRKLDKLWIQNQRVFSFYALFDDQLVRDVPKNFQTQIMWDEYAYKMCEVNVLKNIPEKFQTQKIWDEYARKMAEKRCEVDVLKNIPNNFQHQAMWESYIRKNEIQIYCGGHLTQVPDEYWTQDMWNIYSAYNYIKDVPNNFQTEDMWLKLIKHDPKNILYIPKKFHTDEFYIDALSTSIHILPHVPEHLKTPELWQDYVRNITRYEINKVPVNIFTQEFCDIMVPERPWLIANVPKKYITLEMCENIRYDSYDIKHIPAKYLEIYLNQLPINFFVAENIHYMSGVVMPAKTFNKYFKSINFIKITNSNEIHKGLQYKIGLVADPTYGKVGIHFTWDKMVDGWNNCDKEERCFIRKVTIPDDQLVIFEFDRIKVRKVILSDREPHVCKPKSKRMVFGKDWDSLFF